MLKINRARAVTVVTELMAIPGRSGEESAVAQYITARLREAGLTASAIRSDDAHRHSPIGGERGNLIALLPGSTGRTREPRRMLSGHMDTVPICVGAKPVRRGGRIVSADKSTGLGGDNRSGCAAALITAIEVLEQKLPHPPLTFLWTVQEEVGLNGARAVAREKLGSPRPSMGFNFDGGTPAEVTIAATGASRLTIDVAGIASHAGVHPERGVSAITIASLAIATLHKQGWLGLIRKRGGEGTSNVGVIRGGDATNVMTPAVTLRAEARSHERHFRGQIVKAYQKAFADAAKTVCNDSGACGRVKIDIRHDYESFHLAESGPIVKLAAESVASAGYDPILKICNGGLDANWLCKHGIPTVTLGVGQKDIHTVKESLNVRQFTDACAIALRLATA